ncbi:NADH-quinone oxidoreductase subunit N [Histidinibacterium aquaticum]|uniref:NADH-quinone oxidoreductase subunit N n=1 Tax=Histidinibacterium aquaticum TaxID=2613962 RepID=A0A5J5GBQ6_9RHOB|nr:NADH-quinone oxidoreductase subunit N [Histidinibacterium aquaticum]KAA9005566.1 NADH-quinone oxidoreductase subunit N [Histidinibacterium aquaticum]
MPVGDLAPELAVLLTAVAALLLAMALPQRRHGWCAALAAAGLAVAMGIAWSQAGAARLTFSGTFALDGATTWARLAIPGLTILCVGMSPRWFSTDRRHGEFYAMLLFSALGAMAMAGAADLMQLVMGILLSSVTGYVLAAYHRDWEISLEAGMKYFLVGALANALLVIGVVLVMGMAGSTDYATLAGAIPGDPLTVTGLALILMGLFFKLGAVPVHTWVPDVAEGAPVPAAAFLTVIPKLAGAVALYRLVALAPGIAALPILVALVSAATMTLGNLSALWQEDVRRLIGWSSVSQTGYALMAVAVAGAVPEALPALLAFMTVYGIANILAFAAVAQLRGLTDIEGYRGLIRSQPLAAIALALAFMSFVGIPPIAGFLGKFALFLATLEAGLAWLAVVAVANTVLSLFYYLRVIGPAVFAADTDPAARLGGTVLGSLWAALIVLLLTTVLWAAGWAALPAGLLP